MNLPQQNTNNLVPSAWNKRDCIVWFCFLLLFMGLVLWGIYGVWLQDWRIKTYHQTQGIVTQAELGHDSKGKNSSRHYYPIVVYCYQVDGREYTSDNFSPTRRKWGRKSYIQNLLACYPVGEKILVYYHPREPAKAFIFRDYDFSDYSFILFLSPGLTFLIWIVIDKFDPYRFVKCISICVTWILLMVICYVHYLMNVHQPDWKNVILSMIFGGGLAIFCLVMNLVLRYNKRAYAWSHRSKYNQLHNAKIPELDQDN